LLRAATDLTRRPDVSLREELQLLEGYASIMRERFSDRIEELAFEVPEELLNCRLPSLLLQPLLENAFKHGVEKELGTARLKVSASALPRDRMQVVIECNLGTLPESVRFGTGITNLRERLATTFGNLANLAVEPRAQGGVQSVVTLPCVR
jgi:LytS/YehU family sensor histidine kinase